MPRESKVRRQKARAAELSADDRARRRARIFGRVKRGFFYAALAYPVVVTIAWFIVYHWVRIDPAPLLPAAARTEAITTVRTALDGGEPTRPSAPELQRRARGGPVFVSLWHKGHAVFRHAATAPTIADGVLEGARALKAAPQIAALSAEERAAARIKIDVTRGRGPILDSILPAFSLSIVPGVDGLGLHFGGKESFLLSDDLIQSGFLVGYKPFKFMDWQAGLNVESASTWLYESLGVTAEATADTHPTFFRIKTDGFVEAPNRGAPALPVFRGNTPAPELTVQRLRDAAVAGGRYLLRQLAPNGKFVYEYQTTDGSRSDPVSGPYNMPRHSGTTYFLAQLYSYTRLDEFREGAQRAMGYMAAQIPDSCGHLQPGESPPPYACVTDGASQHASLGATALAINALIEYEVSTGDRAHRGITLKLSEFILFMQRDDGSFAHVYNLGTRERNLKLRTLYFDGEAALALARVYDLTRDAKYLRPLERAMDWVTGGAYNYFAGSFYFGEDHWTCIAADAAWPHLKKKQYVDFCEEYSKFLRRAQFHEGEAPGQDDFVGGYGFTPFFPPNNTPVSSRTETMLSTLRLMENHGRDASATRAQVWRSLGFLVRNQLREDNTYMIHDPKLAEGAMMGSFLRRDVRIDYIQHACSAMIRATTIFAEPPAAPGK